MKNTDCLKSLGQFITKDKYAFNDLKLKLEVHAPQQLGPGVIDFYRYHKYCITGYPDIYLHRN